MSRLLALLLLASVLLASPALAAKVLFDDAHAEDAGNADWVIDDNMPIPSPAQSGITAGSPLDYWTGAISSFGVSMVKRGFTVHTNTAALTYGNSGNAYDLANYDLLVLPEPNTLFTAAEKTAILAFVQNGGGLVAISDHYQSDRNNDGWDSPMIWNDLDPTHSAFGVHFGVSGDANNNLVQTSANVATSPSDSIIRGPVGTVGSLAFHNGTTMTIYPASNPTVRGEVWMTGVAQTATTSIMAASCQYGSGRVFFIGDSSPVDDGSARAGNSSIYDGWGEATDSTLFMNAALWAARRNAGAGDLTPPAVTINSPVGGETWKTNSVHAITWTATDNVGVTAVDLAYSVDGGASYPYTIATNLANSGTYNWTVPNVPGTQNRVRVTARDASTNAGVATSPANFTIDRWIIVATAGAGGTITPSGTIYLANGQSRSFTIAAASGYSIADVVVDGASVGAVGSYTFSNVTANHTIDASFSAPSYSVTVDVVGGGSVARSPDLASYPQGSVVTLDAAPGSGWAFAGWSGDTTGSTDTLSLVVMGARALVATFADVAAPAVSLLAPNGGETWDAGSTQAITWSASDNDAVAAVALAYSTQGPDGPWTPIAAGLANTGAYDWTVPAGASAQVRVRVIASDAAANAARDSSDAAFTILDPSAGVDAGPAVLSLARPAPNPARGVTRLGFSLPREGSARLEVLDASGRRLAGTSAVLGAGPHEWRWDGRIADGSRARAGLYFVRLVTPFGTRLQRLVRLD